MSTTLTRPGDIVIYRAFGDVERTVLVTESHLDIKHGRPGFVGERLTPQGMRTGEPVWGYDAQVTARTRPGI